jgi:hypothetical protein
MTQVVVLYGCVTWSVTLREIVGYKGVEVIKGWRKSHNEELYGSYSTPIIIRVIKQRMMSWAGHVARMRETRKEIHTVALGECFTARAVESNAKPWLVKEVT